MSNKERLMEGLATVLLTLMMALGAVWGIQRDQQPRFRDVTIHAGDEMPVLADFATEYAVLNKCAPVTDLSALDSCDVGEHPITLRCGAREETVMLRILDSLPPELTVQDLVLLLGAELTPETAVTHLWDHDDVELSFDREAVMPADYSPLVLNVIARDGSGNETTAPVTVLFNWLREEVSLEYGETLKREDLLLDPAKDGALITDEALEVINTAPVGDHELTSTSGGRTLTCRIAVRDTKGPELELKELQVYLNLSVKVEAFVVSATDASGEVKLAFVTEPDFYTEGPQTVVIEAQDIYGNVTTAETVLYMVTDMTPPVIYGVNQPLTVAKHSSPNYLENVSAVDNRDGNVEVTVDARRVNTAAAGSYVVIYTARDKSGNTTTYRRTVHVQHDAEDTAALVESIAATLSNDPEAIRDYVRNSIRYSSSWGGEDPVWMGFSDKHGNCYVHALCLKAILDLKGFNTQLIWVTAKSHYWLVIEIEPGVWRHIDATPSSLHSRYSLMTDEQRYWTLSGRDWDRTAWPKCE
jgi:hypothetical protein